MTCGPSGPRNAAAELVVPRSIPMTGSMRASEVGGATGRTRRADRRFSRGHYPLPAVATPEAPPARRLFRNGRSAAGTRVTGRSVGCADCVRKEREWLHWLQMWAAQSRPPNEKPPQLLAEVDLS